MKKLGILTHQMVPNQKTIAMTIELNKMIKELPDIDPIVFFNDLGVCPEKNEFATMQTTEALDYDGILIATDEITVNMLNACICAKKKYFYIWDINWFFNQRPIDYIRNIYINDEINLIVRSMDHYNIVNRVFKKPEYIIEDFNCNELKSVIYDS